jgi:hypothetical protein
MRSLQKPVMPPVIQAGISFFDPESVQLYRSSDGLQGHESVFAENARVRGRKARAIRRRPLLARLLESARRQSPEHRVPPLSFRHLSFRN